MLRSRRNIKFMKSFCIIPARGGSKRIPRKNIKSFRGKPLIGWTIEKALSAGCFDKVIISTDDDEIAKYSKSIGGEVPFLRPTNLADDYTNTFEVIQFTIKKLLETNPDLKYICCLFATAPLVFQDDLKKSFEMISTIKNKKILFGATGFDYPVQRALIFDKEKNVSMLNEEYTYIRSQDLQETFHDAGQFYWGTVNSWLNSKNALIGGLPFFIPRWRVQDIDNMEDWKRVEILHKLIEDKVI